MPKSFAHRLEYCRQDANRGTRPNRRTSLHEPSTISQKLFLGRSAKNFTVPLIFPSAIRFLIATAAPKLAVPKGCVHSHGPPPASRGVFRAPPFEKFQEGRQTPSIPITGLPEPYVATKAVGVSATPWVTSKPLARA